MSHADVEIGHCHLVLVVCSERKNIFKNNVLSNHNFEDEL